MLIRRGICLVILSLLLVTNALAADSPPVAEPGTFWLWTFLGRLHPLAVHFPVGLIIFAAFMEFFTLKQFHSSLRPAIRLSILAGVVSAVIAAVFGWLLAADGDYGKDTLLIHQWSGIATALMGGLAFYFLRRAQTGGNRRRTVKIYRTVLFSTAIAVSLTGHFGASLTHGSDYLSSAFPWNREAGEQTAMRIDFASLKNDTASLDKQQEGALQMQVKAIFAHNCYKCHGAEKVKGDLRLDNKDMLFRGGESGPAFIAGKPEESEIYKRISLPADHKDVMPQKGKKLSGKDIDLIRFWIQKGAPWPESDSSRIFRVASLAPRRPALPGDAAQLASPIDLWVNDYFTKHNIRWPDAVDDITFLRRIYLDIIGLLPTPGDLESFRKDPRPDKRNLRVRQLLDRKDDYAVHWMSFWNDALRNDYTGTGYIDGGRTPISPWLYNALWENKPYDQFVRELISPDKASQGFIEGIQWRGVVNASQRTEMQAAQNVAQVFLGLNLKCASCHNSFVSNWKLDEAYAFANIFSDSSLEINRCDKPTGKFTNARILWKELGEITSDAPSKQKQKELAVNLTSSANGRIYRTIVNRVWAQMMGRGLVEPVDVMDNEPWSQDLLDWLASYFAEEGRFDIKELIYLIATSQTYQLPSVGFGDPNKLTAANYVFTGMVIRRMTAEQFSDAVSRVVFPLFADSLVKFNPYASRPVETGGDGPIRAALVMNNSFLTALGRPNRETVSTGRESQANLLQALELTNGERFNRAIAGGAAEWNKKYPDTKMLVTELYRKALLRSPRENELQTALQLLGASPGDEGTADLLWAVMLLPEFQLIY